MNKPTGLRLGDALPLLKKQAKRLGISMAARVRLLIFEQEKRDVIEADATAARDKHIRELQEREQAAQMQPSMQDIMTAEANKL